MRSNEEFVSEVLDRSEKIIAKRKRRVATATSMTAFGLFVICFIAVGTPVLNSFLRGNSKSEMSGVFEPGKGSVADEVEKEPSDELEGSVGAVNDEEFYGENAKEFRGMTIATIEGNKITLLDASGDEVYYLILPEGIYDTSAEKLLELSQEEEIFWEEIFSLIEEE